MNVVTHIRALRRKKPVTTLIAVLFCMQAPGVIGQTGPAYPALFQDPARTDQLTLADLPNMGRLVALKRPRCSCTLDGASGESRQFPIARRDHARSGTRPMRSRRRRELPAREPKNSGRPPHIPTSSKRPTIRSRQPWEPCLAWPHDPPRIRQHEPGHRGHRATLAASPAGAATGCRPQGHLTRS